MNTRTTDAYEQERQRIVELVNRTFDGQTLPLTDVVALLPDKPEWEQYKVRPARSKQ